MNKTVSQSVWRWGSGTAGTAGLGRMDSVGDQKNMSVQHK